MLGTQRIRATWTRAQAAAGWGAWFLQPKPGKRQGRRDGELEDKETDVWPSCGSYLEDIKLKRDIHERHEEREHWVQLASSDT